MLMAGLPTSVIALRAILSASAALFLASGCGKSDSPKAHLAGRVTIKGASVPSDADAAISFAPLAGGQSVSVPIVDGRYDSPQTPEGKVTVKFYISQPIGPEKESERTGEKFRDVANLVPAKHAAGIVLEVRGDNSNQDFALRI
jgi:hypothetical protein